MGLVSYTPLSYQNTAHDHCCRPDGVEHDRGSLGRNRKRVSTEDRLIVFDRWRRSSKRIDRFKHALGCRDSAHFLLAAEVVPDLAIMRAGLLKEADRSR